MSLAGRWMRRDRMSAWTCHQSDGKVDRKIVPPRFSNPMLEGPSADSEEKHEPVSDIDTDQWTV